MDSLPLELLGRICYGACDPVYTDTPGERIVWPSVFSQVSRRWYSATRQHDRRQPVIRSIRAAEDALQRPLTGARDLTLMLPAAAESPVEAGDALSTKLVAAVKDSCRTLKLIRSMTTEIESMHLSPYLSKLVIHQTALLRPGYGWTGPLELRGLTELSMSIDETVLAQAHVTLFLLSSVVPNLQALAYHDPAQTSVTPDVNVYDLIDRTLISKVRYFSMPFNAHVIQDNAAFDASSTLVDFWMHTEPKEGAHLVERELAKVFYLRIASTEKQQKDGVERDWAWIDETVSTCATALKALVLPSLLDAEAAQELLPKCMELRAKGVAVLTDDADEKDVAGSRVSKVFWRYRRPLSFTR